MVMLAVRAEISRTVRTFVGGNSPAKGKCDKSNISAKLGIQRPCVRHDFLRPFHTLPCVAGLFPTASWSV